MLNKESNLCENCHGLGYVSQLDYNKIVDFNIPLKNVPFRCWNRYKDFYAQMIVNFCMDHKIDSDKTFRELNDKEKKELDIYMCENLEETVNLAGKLAKPGEVVLFSPASASFDMFKDFADRGNQFKKLVHNKDSNN